MIYRLQDTNEILTDVSEVEKVARIRRDKVRKEMTGAIIRASQTMRLDQRHYLVKGIDNLVDNAVVMEEGELTATVIFLFALRKLIAEY